MSAGTYLGTAIVIEARYGYEGIRDLSFFLQAAAIELVPFDAEQAEIAREAYARYGKGRGGAGLNFGDCFAYALAKLRDEPLLFKGDDFARTDVMAAL
jgi:ribonuclease VapC